MTGQVVDEFDVMLLEKVRINPKCVQMEADVLVKHFENLTPHCEAAWLLKAVSCIDLTTLGGDDAPSNVARLCRKAVDPITHKILDQFGCFKKNKEKEGDAIVPQKPFVTVAAVCVYPSRVRDAVVSLEQLDSSIPVASVATGFPSGQYPLETRLAEIKYCVSSGAKEIDIVLDRTLVLLHKWSCLYEEVKAMVAAAGDAHVKAILAVGECGSLENIYKAAMVSMMAGVHFIKTSTGKETVNATLPYGIVMCRAIKDFEMRTGKKIGLKPAGGLKTSQDAINWLGLVKIELGDDWLCPQLFRIGASSLLGSIENRLIQILLRSVVMKK